MVTFNYEEQEGKKYLVYSKRAQDKADLLTMEMMSNNKIDGLIPFESIQIDGELTLKYNVTGLENLEEYFSGVVGRKKLLHVLEGIVSGFIEAEDYFLDLSSYVLEESYIYVEPATEKIFMVVLPFFRDKIKPEVFLKKLLLEVRYDQSEDCSYVAGLINLFSGSDGFSLYQFREQLMRFQEIKEEKKEEVTPQAAVFSKTVEEKPVQPPVWNVPMSEQQVNVEEKPFYIVDNSIKNEEQQENEGEKKKKGIFWKKEERTEKQKSEKKGFFWKKSKKNEEKDTGGSEKGFPFVGLNIPGSDQQSQKKENGENIEGTYQPYDTPIPAQKVGVDLRKTDPQDFGPTEYVGGNSEETIFIDEGKSKLQSKPVLYRTGTQEVFEIQGDMIRIGRNPAISEICISGNRGIGRIHAVLYVNNGQVGIVDNDSKNKTYVNGEQLKPGDTPRILSPGDKIQLADEELEFRISQ